ncbi:hypothetical protein LDENG_00157350 [Lucifuga dentata]|nr:hypothetical protein LDENG_00157350 [Lucifuga dentata]
MLLLCIHAVGVGEGFGGERSGDLVQVKGIMKKELPFHPSKTRDSIWFSNYWSEFHSSTGNDPEYSSK